MRLAVARCGNYRDKPHGTVESAQVIMDRDTGRSKGFGFVEMKTDQEAQAAIAGLNGNTLSLSVNELDDKGRPVTNGKLLDEISTHVLEKQREEDMESPGDYGDLE